MFDIIELQNKLISVAGTSSFESARAELIYDIATPLCDEVSIDCMGNVIAHINGKPGGKRIMISAHMDTIGIIATYIESDGRIRFENLGGISAISLLNSTVCFENGVYGCIGIDNATTPRKRREDYSFNDMFVDIGVKSREEVLRLISLGDTAAYTGSVYQQGDSIVSIYLDNLIAVSIQLCVMQQIEKSENDLYFVFSVQEEIGALGAEVAAKCICPDIGIAIDVTESEDSCGATIPGLCVCGGGAAIKIRDGSVTCNRQIVELLRTVARCQNIPHQCEILLGGGTDTSPIQASRSGVLSCCISVPTRYIHSQSEMCSYKDVENVIRLLLATITQSINLNGVKLHG